MPADARAAEVLPLLRRLRQAEIVTFDTGSSTRLSNHVARTVRLRAGVDVDADLAADEALRAELIVGQRQHGADAELPIQLVERRRAEAQPMSPHTLTRSVT